MKLCVSIEYRPEGGLYSFVATFLDYLRVNAIPFTQFLDDEYDVLFVNSWVVPFADVRRVRRVRPEVRVVQRVDGSARDYGRFDDADWKQARVNLLADFTIFQSQYSRFSAREKFRVIYRDGPVIYNPVDVDRFRPEGPTLELPAARVRVASAAWSPNRMKGTWQINRLAVENPDVEFVLCGRFDAVQDRPNVLRLGHLTRDQMAMALRSCSVFLNLSENDPCPNVVLEALASGLPVVFKASGGVPELVGDAGVPIRDGRFRDALDEGLRRRPELARAARERAVTRFAPAVIFPQYLEAVAAAKRQPPVGRWRVVALGRQGYPVLPRLSDVPRAWARAVYRRSPSAVQTLVDRARHAPAVRVGRQKPCRIGWVTYDSFLPPKAHFHRLDSFTRMRVGNVAEWLNAHSEIFHNELYRRGERYDIVIFQKMMDERCHTAVRDIQAAGGKVVFDANVNYYEIWGEYFVPGTQPTEVQKRDAICMARHADWVVADSSYLAEIIRRITPRVTWIPDNVDLDLYRGVRRHGPTRPIRLVWSGVAKKAAHLLIIRDVLARLQGVELVIVSDAAPDVRSALEAVIPCRVRRFSDRVYARILLGSDIIISPKRLTNGYEMAHTEYKITLGMAVGLPAIASPQPSYVEAISYAGGGIIANTPDEWHDALTRLSADHVLRAEMGARARRAVVERYSTPAVAQQFLSVFESLVGLRRADVGQSHEAASGR